MSKFEALPDVLGNILEIGDIVASISASSPRVLVIAEVIKFSKKQVTVKIIKGDKYRTGYTVSRPSNLLVRITDDPMTSLALLK